MISCCSVRPLKHAVRARTDNKTATRGITTFCGYVLWLHYRLQSKMASKNGSPGKMGLGNLATSGSCAIRMDSANECATLFTWK